MRPQDCNFESPQAHHLLQHHYQTRATNGDRSASQSLQGSHPWRFERRGEGNDGCGGKGDELKDTWRGGLSPRGEAP